MFYNEKIFKRCFDWRGKYWYKNIKEIPLYFKLMHHLIKHGYDEYATWGTFDWFIDTMKEILTTYRKNHQGYPVAPNFNDMLQDELNAKYDGDIDRMISLLDAMDECSEQYENVSHIEQYNAMVKAKDEFFQLFANYFYDLWD